MRLGIKLFFIPSGYLKSSKLTSYCFAIENNKIEFLYYEEKWAIIGNIK